MTFTRISARGGAVARPPARDRCCGQEKDPPGIRAPDGLAGVL